jgi:hypothetical protein
MEKLALRAHRTTVGPRSVQIATPQLAPICAASAFISRPTVSTGLIRRRALMPMPSAAGPRS